MRNLICILIISLNGVALFSTPNFSTITPEPQSVNVMAFSGLKMRAAPNLNGQLLVVVPYGERVDVIEKSDIEERIEWITGNWIKVNYEGIEGFVFDGFTSDLPVPSFNFELTSNDSEVVFPLITWTQYRFEEIQTSDTLVHDGHEKITQYFNNGITLQREESKYHLKTSLEIGSCKISEAYNLVRSILLTKQERKAFEDKSIFMTNNSGQLERIKIGLDSPIEIKKTSDGGVIINAVTFYVGC